MFSFIYTDRLWLSMWQSSLGASSDRVSERARESLPLARCGRSRLDSSAMMWFQTRTPQRFSPSTHRVTFGLSVWWRASTHTWINRVRFCVRSGGANCNARPWNHCVQWQLCLRAWNGVTASKSIREREGGILFLFLCARTRARVCVN